jgi:hypothetical protein
MKKLLNSSLLIMAVAMCSLSSCEGPDMASMENTLIKYQDSVSGLVPGTQAVQGRLERDFNTESITLKLIIVSADFYDSRPDVKKDAAIRGGQIALRMFGKNIDKGVLIISKDKRFHPKDPEDGRIADMMIDSLKNAVQTK